MPPKIVTERSIPNEIIQPNWTLEIHQLDVGQGDGAFIGFINHTYPAKSILFMIDAGPKYVNKEVVSQFKYFIDKIPNIPNRLHAVFRGSKDIDHSAGLPNPKPNQNSNKYFDQLVNFQTKFFSYENNVNNKFPYTACNVGDNIWKLLRLIKPSGAPNLEIIASNGRLKGGEIVINKDCNDNDKSLGFLITYNKFGYLTAGDLTSKTEDRIHFDIEEVSMTKIGHHGSEFSTSTNLLKKLNPRATIISHGAKHNHPTHEVLERIESSPTKFNYLTNPAAYSRGDNYLIQYPKVVVAGSGDFILQSRNSTDICKANYGKLLSGKNQKGHVTIKVDQSQSKRGEFNIEYDRKPPEVIHNNQIQATRSKDRRARSVKDKFKTSQFAIKKTEIFEFLQKTHKDIIFGVEYQLDLSSVDISDFEEDKSNKIYATCKFKENKLDGHTDRISIKIFDKDPNVPSTMIRNPKLIAKKRYFKDKSHGDQTISRTQTNYR